MTFQETRVARSPEEAIGDANSRSDGDFNGDGDFKRRQCKLIFMEITDRNSRSTKHTHTDGDFTRTEMDISRNFNSSWFKITEITERNLRSTKHTDGDFKRRQCRSSAMQRRNGSGDAEEKWFEITEGDWRCKLGYAVEKW